jgi:polyhydroxyalkanoate synthase subunit PhaC
MDGTSVMKKRKEPPQTTKKENSKTDAAQDQAVARLVTHIDPVEFAQNLSKVAAQSQRLVREFLEHTQTRQAPLDFDPFNIGGAFLEMTARLMADPVKLYEAQIDLWRRYLALWENVTSRALGLTDKPLILPDPNDRRFKDAAWGENRLFDYIKQSYLLSARWLQNTVQNIEGLDEKTRQKVDFYTRQFVDAMAPTNFVMTNPEVLRATIESNGQNLVEGLQNMLEDFERGQGQFNIRMSDPSAFKIGKNIAVTPGKVIYENELMQLIQYEAQTETVFKIPIFIIPPWINKYYILDLRPEKSFVAWLVAQGFTVFILSWVNPDARLSQKNFEDYLQEGIVEGIAVIRKTTQEMQIHAVGYCLGGTMLAAYLAAVAEDKNNPIKTATLLAAQTDFSEAGELTVFIDEDQLEYIEELMEQKGYLSGRTMARTFNMLRANDLIWSFVVNNYLLGKDPFPFDFLFWNADSTRMPAAMHSYYLRQMYQHNNLAKPNHLNLLGQNIDLRKVKTPTYIQASREDHIAPYRSVYKTVTLFQGPVRFILAGSGHIAGVINAPSSHKYSYWKLPDDVEKNPASIDEWLNRAVEQKGSWWPDWRDWLAPQSGEKVDPRDIGGQTVNPIEDAPGRYVFEKSID